jgi:hypothetical protein
MHSMNSVVSIQDQEEKFAEQIHAGEAKYKDGRRLVVEATVELAIAVAGARELHKSDRAFGSWWNAQGFELNEDDRAALCAMGKDPERLREVLGVTARVSIRHIYLEEFRFRHVAKPENSEPRKVGRPKKVKPEPEIAEPVANDPPPIDPSILSLSAQAKLEAFKRQARKEIENELMAQFGERVEARVQEIVNKFLFPKWGEQIKFAETFEPLAKANHFPFTRDEYKLILSVLHPDMNATTERKNEAFMLFRQHEKSLIKPAAPKIVGDFPSSAAELMARRKKKASA